MYRELIKGTLDTMILKLLEENGRLYGYQLTKIVHERSGGSISIKEGSLYPALHRMEKNKIITSEVEIVGNRPRKYYSLTSSGQGEIIKKVNEISQFIQDISKVLSLKPL